MASLVIHLHDRHHGLAIFPLQVSLCSARLEKCAADVHTKPYVSPQCQSVSGVPAVSFGSASSVPLQPYKLKPHLPVFLPNLSDIKSFQQLCSWAVTDLMASKRIIIASIQQKLFQRDQHFSCFTDSHICLFPCTCNFSARLFFTEIFTLLIATDMGRPWYLSHWPLMIRFALFKSHLTFHPCLLNRLQIKSCARSKEWASIFVRVRHKSLFQCKTIFVLFSSNTLPVVSLLSHSVSFCGLCMTHLQHVWCFSYFFVFALVTNHLSFL